MQKVTPAGFRPVCSIAIIKDEIDPYIVSAAFSPCTRLALKKIQPALASPPRVLANRGMKKLLSFAGMIIMLTIAGMIIMPANNARDEAGVLGSHNVGNQVLRGLFGSNKVMKSGFRKVGQTGTPELEVAKSSSRPGPGPTARVAGGAAMRAALAPIMMGAAFYGAKYQNM
jgi:hypothetical protein